MRLEHGVIARDPERYFGWPANHGGWQRDSEILVGFMEGTPSNVSCMHHVDARSLEFCFARSRDNGHTWTIENAPDFACRHQYFATPEQLSPDRIFRMTGYFDHGGGPDRGNFFSSADFGHTWDGPFVLDVPVPVQYKKKCTTRTCRLGNTFYCTYRTGGFGSDVTYSVDLTPNGFENYQIIVNDYFRAAMPSVCENANGTRYMALRRADGSRYWIEVYEECDSEWHSCGVVMELDGWNGNPPSLVCLPDGRLCCFYGNRGIGTLIMSVSEDGGKKWRHQSLRGTPEFDFGYPKAFVTGPTEILVTYYWKELNEPPYIATTRVEL